MISRSSRLLTVLFTDVVGSTSRLARLGEDMAERVRSQHFSDLRAALAIHRGSEVKTLGDGIMAVFDSVSDALSCAVTMQSATNRHRKETDDLEIRIGVAVGEVTYTEADYFGLPVVLASRLCERASAGQVLVADVVRSLTGGCGLHKLDFRGELELKGLPAPTPTSELVWDGEEDGTLRVAVADDSLLVREAVTRSLEAEGLNVVLEVSDGESLLAELPVARPHVVVLDVRMPPTHTVEGLIAAERIRAENPGIGVLVLSADAQAAAARRLLEGTTEGVGYLLKERLGDMGDLVAAIRTIANGGSAIDPLITEQLALLSA